ncbi:spore germination protein (amino acid permease) [Amphibacillus marinus]|uniref:Spore germination protein (Amino acid permease) n=1 Tax=Amphibacillus marinus TaxID=872970 RepID=A0A1H8PDQ0_9BACI|nr:GerAB/ArcD/ProY family transporter [Amphibacillus marinus]SEO39663.1 spore germination protein (amino acid permease) [Amphibacillus marinus]
MNVNKKLSSFEMFSMTLILIGMKLSDTTPSLFAQKSQNALWYIPFLAFLIVLPSFFVIMYLLEKVQAKHLVNLFELLLGKLLGKGLAFFIFLLSFLMISLDSRNYVEQIKTLYFERSSSLIIFVLFCVVCVFGAIRGIEVIGYTSKVLIPFLTASLVLVIFLVYEHMIWERIYPIFGSGLQFVLKESLFKGSIFADFILLTMAYSSFKKPSDFKIGGLIALFIAVLEITFLFLIYATVFDYNSIEKVSFPFHEITQYVQLGDFFTNIETFFMVFWLLATFLRFILLLYLQTWLFGAIFNIDEFELLVLPLGFLSMVIGLIPDNSVVTELVYRNQLLDLLTPVLIVLPFLLLAIYTLRRKQVT